MTTHPDRYPYTHADALIGPVAAAAQAVLAGTDPGDGTAWPRLGKPVAHITPQPADTLAAMTGEPPAEQLWRLVWLAFSYGVCQGYAMAEAEAAERAALLAELDKLRRGRRRPADEPHPGGSPAPA